MKKIYTLLQFLVVFSMTQLQAQAPPELIHYNFNNTGTLVPNYASTPPLGTSSGTVIGAMTQGVSLGQCGQALSGSGSIGSSDYVNTNWTFSVSGSWSIAFWTASITPSSTLWYIFGESSSVGFRCFTNGAAGANNWLLRGTGMTDMLLTNGAVMAATHNVFVYDAANSQGRIYLNGVLQSTVAQSPTSFSGAGPFKVGAYGSNNNLNGLMDEFRFYARALTNSEVAAIALGAPSAGTQTISSCGPYTSVITNSVYATSGVYTETYTSCGGTSTNNIALTVITPPTMSITSNVNNICSGTTVSLTASGSVNSYTWNGTGPNTSTLAVLPAANSVYTLVGSNGTVCPVTRTIAINVTATPTIGLTTSGANVCAGNTFTASASGAVTYTWSTGVNTSTMQQLPTTNTVYLVSANNGSCSSSSSISITVTQNPTLTVSPLSPTVCAGTTVSITASGAANVAWSNGGTGTVIAVTAQTNTTYIVVGISNNCADTKSINLTVLPSPTVTVLSNSVTVCSGSTAVLTANGATTYSWSTGATGNPVNVNPTGPTVYTVSGTSGSCSKTATININTLQAPNVSVIASSTAVCAGNTISLVGTGAVTYTWSTGLNGAALTATPSASTTYTMYGAGTNQCAKAVTVSVIVNANPTVSLTTSKATICKGNTATLTASGASTYTWSHTFSGSNTQTVNPSTTRTYTVTGYDANGCSMQLAITQTVNACLGIVEKTPEQIKINVSPNPGKGMYVVDYLNASDVLLVEVYSSTGQLVRKTSHQGGVFNLDLQNEANGIYYLRITAGFESELTKVIKE
jgi:hypothetical protein